MTSLIFSENKLINKSRKSSSAVVIYALSVKMSVRTENILDYVNIQLQIFISFFSYIYSLQ